MFIVPRHPFNATTGLTFSPAGPFLLAASITSAVELQAVMGDLKAVTLGDPPLEGFECLVLEFNDLSAIEANEVIMVGPFRSRLKSGLSVGEFSLGG
jgi:hypothetical protein